MTDPLSLAPILSPDERPTPTFSDPNLTHEERYNAFVEHVQAGLKVEARDWMPDEYRTSVLRFVEMHANSELMGVLPEREWIMRAPTLKRKLALTAKVQDECGHAQLLYRVAEDLGKPREQMYQDLLDGKTKFHNVFHYPTKSWGDVGIIAWLVDAAAIVAQQALRESCVRAVQPDDEEDLLGGVGPHHARPRRGRDDDERQSDAARHGPGGARSLVGAADADARPAHRSGQGPRPLLAHQGEDRRAAAPGVPVDVRAATMGDRPVPARSGAAPRRGERRVALHRAGLAGAAHGGHRPRPQVAGAAGFPATEPRRHGVGSPDDPRRARPRPPDVCRERAHAAQRRSARRGRPAGGGRSIGRLRGLSPGEGRRPDAPRRQRHRARHRAGHALRPRVLQPPPGERPAVGRAADADHGSLRSGSAPAAARSQLQEAGRLRDARQARGGQEAREEGAADAE